MTYLARNTFAKEKSIVRPRNQSRFKNNKIETSVHARVGRYKRLRFFRATVPPYIIRRLSYIYSISLNSLINSRGIRRRRCFFFFIRLPQAFPVIFIFLLAPPLARLDFRRDLGTASCPQTFPASLLPSLPAPPRLLLLSSPNLRPGETSNP